MSEAQTVYLGSNEEVAQRLGITPAGLRRLADIYGEVYEPLQRDTHYNNRRLWTLAAVERLEAARELVQAGGARSIKIALLMLKGGIERPVEGLALPSKEVSKDPLLLAILEHVQGLEARIDMMQEQLEAPKRIAVIDNSQSDELRRMKRLSAWRAGAATARGKDQGEEASVVEVLVAGLETLFTIAVS